MNVSKLAEEYAERGRELLMPGCEGQVLRLVEGAVEVVFVVEVDKVLDVVESVSEKAEARNV